MKIRVAIVGKMGFPMPLSTPPITSLIPQIKYVLETMIIFCRENSITAGDVDRKDESCTEKVAENEPKVTPNAVAINMALAMICFTRFMFRAPMFWATKGMVATDGA